MLWRVVNDSLLVGRYGAARPIISALPATTRVAAFDFDSTLIKTASGKIFSRSADDWKWWHSSVPGRLKELHNDGYLLAIVSNQGGISLKPDPKTVKSDQKRLADFKTKISTVLHQLDLPISIYAATSRDQYRKPRTGMWREIVDDFDLDSTKSLNIKNSVFVGDAGGREPVGGGGGKDHSCVDRCVALENLCFMKSFMLNKRRDFAANVGLAFSTPEEFFLNEQPRTFVRSFDPSQYIKERAGHPIGACNWTMSH